MVTKDEIIKKRGYIRDIRRTDRKGKHPRFSRR